MNAEVGVQWVAYATRQTVDEVKALLTDDQLAVIGRRLSENKLLNPPKVERVRYEKFVCHCGCGEWFMAKYKTKKPQFKNESHRKRYWRQKWAAQARDGANDSDWTE